MIIYTVQSKFEYDLNHRFDFEDFVLFLYQHDKDLFKLRIFNLTIIFQFNTPKLYWKLDPII